ncbi:unnamed protein product [Rotaria sordida]|uniref:Fibronectin type-III domain-containing protein n=1 Tax=Rotaria sordida TaxID=392033 RepID=A0A819MY60_9BILA|nr:unnamed protein product [Rotaria sordida]CAF3985528.1 unnamed protein product [Rotaria sordida]
MSIENNSTIKIMALGRPFKLGMLYDFRTDKLIHNISLWNSDLSSEYIHQQPLSWTRSELYLSDKFTEKADLLGIDNNLKLSILANLVELSSSTCLIDDQKKTNQTLRFILKYSMTKNLHELTMSDINKMYNKHREVFYKENATHIVTSILYGREIFFIFDRILSNDENRIDIENNIKLLLKKFDTFQIFNNGELNWKDYEKQLANTLTCQYYGDFQYESNPITFEQAFKLYKHSLNFVLQNNDYGIPKQIWIYPIYLLDQSYLIGKKSYQINNDILMKSLELFDNLYQLKITLNNFKNNLSSIKMFYRTEEQISTYFTRIFEIDISMRNQMKELLPKIRDGSMKEIDFTNLLKNFHLSLSNKQKLDELIQFKTEEINQLKNFQKDLKKQNNIHLLTCSFAEVQKNFTSKFILRLIIHITEKNDSLLNEIFQYFDDNIKKSLNQYTKNNYWFNENNIKIIKKQISSFIQFAEINSSKSNIEFIANEEYVDEFQMKKGVTCILYQNGISTNFEIPSEPGRPYGTNVSDCNLTLCWSKPIDGSQYIQQYKIYSKNISNDTWKLLLTTENATLFVNISDLINGKYQFKIQGVTRVGNTVKSNASDVIELKAPQPTKIINKPTPIVMPNEVTNEKATFDVTPAWFEPVKPIPKEKIRFPVKYNENSPTDVRTYNCLSTYRSMVKKTSTIDFVTEPFSSAVNNTETLVVVLNELAEQLGARLSFTNADYKYNDSDYRTACGVTNLGSIHSFLASEGNFQTAKFDLHLDLNYDNIRATPESLRMFVLTTINDIGAVTECDRDFIRVFSVKRASSIFVQIGFTTPERSETEKLAKSFKEKLNKISATNLPDIVNKESKKSVTSVKEKLNKISIVKRPDILKYLIPENYDYRIEPALALLQLQQSDFEPRYNRDYPYANEETRGGLPYYFPQGWYRHALKVIDKYPDDKAWLGMNNGPGEWAVAYHGTKASAVKGIKNEGLLHSLVSSDVMKLEAKQQNPSIPDVKGLYVAIHCERGAADYTKSFKIKDDSGTSKDYGVVFQCRVQPGKFTVHPSPVRVGMAWRVFDEKAIRPYGLLLKSS